MKLENQVCSLEQAKKLRELGIVQDTLFSWCVLMPDPTGERYYYEVKYRDSEEQTLTELIAAAFTVAELGVMLPLYCDTVCTHTHWDCVYNTRPNGIIHQELCHPTEAQARAAMLIYLLENNHITASEVNQRLAIS